MAEHAVSSPSLPASGAVVLNWRQPERTLDCLRALLEATEHRMPVFVLDNGSGDGSWGALCAGVADLGEGVELVRSTENLGFCAGVNRGLAWASERGLEQLLVLNNDVTVSPGFLEPLSELLAMDHGVGCVGPAVLDPLGRVWAEGAVLRFGPNVTGLRRRGHDPTARDKGPIAVDFMPGACALYRVADLIAVGGMDENYFMYHEDADLGLRLKARGLRSVCLPWVRVEHEPSASSGGGRSPLRKFLTSANAMRLLRSHGRPRDWLAFLVCDVAMLPLAFARGLGPGMAKVHGLWTGLRGRKVGAKDVRRYLG